MSEYIYYKVGDKRAKVRSDKKSEFESQYPDAKVYYTYQGRNAAVPISGVDAFKEKYGAENVSYSVLDDFKSSATTNDKHDDTSLVETVVKGIGSAGAGTAKLALDLGRLAFNTSAVGGAIRALQGKSIDESLQDENNPLTKASMKLGETQERWSREADPTGGETGFWDLVKEGKIGTAAQKAVGSGLESLPMMLAAGTGFGALLYGAAMAAGKYSDETRENPDIPAWKRGVNAIGSSAIEMAVEKLGGPLKNLGKAGKGVTDDIAKEILETAVKDGKKNVSQRIVSTIGKMTKEGVEEGGEEVLTSFGNDALGEALDIIDGDKDYGIRAQWEQMKEQNPDASLKDFANAKAEEYMDSFLGGALSGMEISGGVKGINSIARNPVRSSMDNARSHGETLSTNSLYDIDADVNNKRAEVGDLFVDKDGNHTLSNEFIETLSAEDAFALSQREDFSNKQRIAFGNLAVSKSAQDGLNQKLDAERDARINEQNEMADKVADNGSVVSGMYNNKLVYIKGGVANPDGTVKLANTNDNGPVIIIDSATGEQTTVRSEDITGATSQSVDEFKAKAAEIISTNDFNIRETARNTMSPIAKFREVKQYAKKKILVDVGNGVTEVYVQEISPNGDVILKGKKKDLGGQSILPMKADTFYDSIYRNEDGNPVVTDAGTEVETEVHEVGTESVPAEPVDYREGSHTILIDGVPTEVEVDNQDDVSNSIVYRYVDVNGNEKIQSTDIGSFGTMVQEANDYTVNEPETVATATPTVDEVDVTTTDTQPVVETTLEPKSIDWDVLFEQDPENYFVEIQNQFGDRAPKRLNALAAATQKKLDALNKATPETDNEILENEEKKERLEAKIESLNGMIARLSAPAVDTTTETVVESTPADEVQVEEVPPTTVAEVEETPVTEEVVETATPEVDVEPVVEPQETAEVVTPAAETAPVEETPITENIPVAPNPVKNPTLEAQRRENRLVTLLERKGVSGTLKEDAAFKAGKEVGDMFPTREDYEAYAENGTDLGEYFDAFERGVDESFAKRSNNESGSPEVSDALLFRKKMIKDFSDMTDEELYDFLDEYEGQYSSYSTDGNAYHNYLKEPNKDIIEAIKKSIISNEFDEVGSSVVFVGDYAYLVDHLKPSELSKDSNGIGIIRKVNISGVEKSEKDLLKESIHEGRVRNRRDVNQWVSAYRAKRELYNRYFGSAEDAEAALVDGRLDWKELGERLLSRNEGSMEKGGLSTEIGKEVPENSIDIRHRRGGSNTKLVEQFEQKHNNERQELTYSNEFRGLQEESSRMSEQQISEFHRDKRKNNEDIRQRLGETLQRELDSAIRSRGYKVLPYVNEAKGTSFDIIENVDGRLFHDIFSIVRNYLPNGELVDLHDSYEDAICYITSDGLAGFAVTADGNLVSVYNLYGESKPGFLGAIKDLITKAGATHLDGYNSVNQPLAVIYSNVFGWKAASMMDYNMEYDHDSIAENHGMPQVAFMVNTEAYIPTKHFNKDQYDEAVEHQLEQVEIGNRTDSQNRAIDNLAGGQRQRAIQSAVNKEAEKLGVSVTYVTREEMPKGHKRDKGYYNTTTGEIVICIDNAVDVADAIKTILHEAVAHKGLRQLMGDKFNEFISRVYNSLDAETKAKVDARATAHYNGNTAVAMEEYMATLAESEDFNKTSVWDNIKAIFEDIINAILSRNDMKIGDEELRYILRASYNNMVNPRNMDTIRGWAQDQMMREEYKINEPTPEILSRTGINPEEASSETAKEVYDNAVNDMWQEFQRQMQDAMQPVRIGIDAIQQETGNMPIEEYENYILMHNQASSRSRAETDKFRSKYYEPIVDETRRIINELLESRGIDINDEAQRAKAYSELKAYLIAKHGLERNSFYQSTKTRKMNKEEMAKELESARMANEEKVNQINADESLSESEKRAQLSEALVEYNRTIEELKTKEVPNIRDYSGLTSLFGTEDLNDAENQAREAVKEFENSVDTTKLWEKINAATNKTLRHSYESGLLSRSQYNDIKNMFKFYIPLRGFDETTAEDVYSYSRFEGNRFNSVVQSAKGRTSLADDPIAIIMNMAASEIAQGNNNRAKQALYYFILNRPIMGEDGIQRQNSLMQVEDVWYVESVDKDGNTVYQIAAPNHETGETYEMFESRMMALESEGNAQKSKKGKLDVGMRFQRQRNANAHYVYLRINGVDKAIYINGDPKAAEAINGTYKSKPNDAESVMRNLNRLISSTFTNYSLEFTARNYFRDMIYSNINLSIKESDPAYRKKFRQNWRQNNLPTMIKMLKAYRAGEYDGVPLNEDEAAFVEFMNNGGQTGYTLINSVENHKRELEKELMKLQNGVDKGGVKGSSIVKTALNGIELLNEASELVTRFAAFKTSRDMGRGVLTSVNDAKEITVNFNTKGAQDGKGWMGLTASYFGWSKFFFNASVQGVQNIKAMKDANKLKFCSVVGGIAATGFLMPVITAAISSMLGGDEEEYWNIPEYDRQNNLCIVLGNGKYAKLPLPIGFREVFAIGDMVSAMAFNKKFTRDASSVGMDIANKIASTVLPINPLESTANGLSIWHTLLYTALPSSLQFGIQNLSNTDWKGAPLQKEYTYNEDDPQWMKAYASNPEWLISLSKWCNENTKFGDYEGWDWSPEKVDNTLSNMFGGIYSLIKKTGRGISAIWNEENRTISNIPLASVVIGSGIDSDERFATSSYYDMLDYYNANLSFIKRRAKMFGYNLEDVFVKEKGKRHPKMLEIYNNSTFDWMQEWYKGNEDLNKIKKEIDKLEKEIASSENPTIAKLNKLERMQAKFDAKRSEFVDAMLELD